MMPAETSGSVTLKQGKAVIPVGTMKEPGFRDCRLTPLMMEKVISIM